MSPVSRRVFLGAVTATAVTASACSPDEAARTAGEPSTTGSATPSTPPPGATSSPVPGATTPPSTSSAPPTAPATGSPAADLLHGPRTRREVALTFHGAGDLSLTERVARRRGRPGTHYRVRGRSVAGRRADRGPDIVSAGHELGNHTWSHQEMPRCRLGPPRSRRGADAWCRLRGEGVVFRPSGTRQSTAMIRAAASRRDITGACPTTSTRRTTAIRGRRGVSRTLETSGLGRS